MPNNQHLMAGQITHWANGAPHPDTLHLLDATKEASKKNWDFQIKFVATMRQCDKA
jgi:hypothetical protein